jgi:hypothetical protein
MQPALSQGEEHLKSPSPAGQAVVMCEQDAIMWERKPNVAGCVAVALLTSGIYHILHTPGLHHHLCHIIPVLVHNFSSNGLPTAWLQGCWGCVDGVGAV